MCGYGNNYMFKMYRRYVSTCLKLTMMYMLTKSLLHVGPTHSFLHVEYARMRAHMHNVSLLYTMFLSVGIIVHKTVL